MSGMPICIIVHEDGEGPAGHGTAARHNSVRCWSADEDCQHQVAAAPGCDG
jgi:hypothetical protein